jgi:hypothetical protein
MLTFFGLGYVHWDADEYGRSGSGVFSTILGFLFLLWLLYATILAINKWTRGFIERRRHPGTDKQIDSYFWTLLGILGAAGILTVISMLGIRLISFFQLNLKAFFWKFMFAS